MPWCGAWLQNLKTGPLASGIAGHLPNRHRPPQSPSNLQPGGKTVEIYWAMPVETSPKEIGKSFLPEPSLISSAFQGIITTRLWGYGCWLGCRNRHAYWICRWCCCVINHNRTIKWFQFTLRFPQNHVLMATQNIQNFDSCANQFESAFEDVKAWEPCGLAVPEVKYRSSKKPRLGWKGKCCSKFSSRIGKERTMPKPSKPHIFL